MFKSLILASIRNGTRLACVVIIAETVRDVAVMITETYAETHQAAAKQANGVS